MALYFGPYFQGGYKLYFTGNHNHYSIHSRHTPCLTGFGITEKNIGKPCAQLRAKTKMHPNCLRVRGSFGLNILCAPRTLQCARKALRASRFAEVKLFPNSSFSAQTKAFSTESHTKYIPPSSACARALLDAGNRLNIALPGLNQRRRPTLDHTRRE